MKQTDRVYDYIEQFGSITPLQALADLGVMRLASRISDLKGEGVEFDVEMERSKNRFGEAVRFARYTFHKEPLFNIHTSVTFNNNKQGELL